MKLPHFFRYAKDKEEGQIATVNKSTVNKLNKIIPNKAIKFKEVVGTFDYKVLLNNKRISENINEQLIERFIEINKQKRFMYNENEMSDYGFNNYLIKELSKINSNNNYVCDVLVYYFFSTASKYKETLWKCYGELIYNNLVSNLKGSICCDNCGKRTERKTISQIYCDNCAKEIKKERNKERIAKYRKNKDK